MIQIEGAPFGEGNKEALEFMLNLAKRDGFKFENVDGYAGHIDSKEYIGSIGRCPPQVLVGLIRMVLKPYNNDVVLMINLQWLFITRY